MKFDQNFVTAWSRNMTLVYNPSKIYTSYSLKPSITFENQTVVSKRGISLKKLSLCVYF